jgi:DNA-binding HxlR family transcriptional regulator
MALLDLLGRRWALRILWELREGPATFRTLRQRADDVSPSVLGARLAELRAAGIVELDAPHGYRASRHGRDLLAALTPLQVWAGAWARRQA